MAAGRNRNNLCEWEANGNKTRLNLGLGTGINHWEWEGMGWKGILPLNPHRPRRLDTRVFDAQLLCPTQCKILATPLGCSLFSFD